MRRTVEFTAAFTLAATLALSGCADPSTPTQPVDQPSFFTHAPAPGYSVVRRAVPLAEVISVTRTVGPDGGRIDIVAAGFSLVVPAGALDGPAEITVEARAGDAFAFEMAPAGLRFRLPVAIELRSRGTDAEDRVLSAAPGTTLSNVVGVSFEPDPDGHAIPLRTLPVERTGDGYIVETLTLMAGYATASG